MQNDTIYAADIASLRHAVAQRPAASQYFILVDENTLNHCLPHIINHLPQPLHIIEIRSGEHHKNLDTVQYIWHQLLMQNADRQAVMILLGGGVLGDMGAFAAATYKRGIDFVHIPTTVLSMTDAAIGGKTAINFGDFKNTIGTFTPAMKTIIAPVFLETLPKNQWLNGFAETIKHALIVDKNLFNNLPKNNLDFNNQKPDWLLPSAQIKQDIVRQDFTEKKQRKLLNYGHTIGHSIESHCLNTRHPLLHGEAIAVGMVIENFLANHLNILSDTDMNTANQFIFNHYNHIFIHIEYQNLHKYLLQDKKNAHQNINFSLLTVIGAAQYDCYATPAQIQFAINQYNITYM